MAVPLGLTGCDRGSAAAADNDDPFHLALAFVESLQHQDEDRMRGLVQPGDKRDQTARSLLSDIDAEKIVIERLSFDGLFISIASVVATLSLIVDAERTAQELKLNMQETDGLWYIVP
ncbi:MAG TPA: hypothetical protein VJ777_27455 [Mycobacterium sp.]|nr:hypothetical protein [Mycobacterium sp.]